MMERATLSDSERRWRLLAMIPVGGAALLALYSGDVLLILAVLSAAAGLALLALPELVRRAEAPQQRDSRHDRAAGRRAA